MGNSGRSNSPKLSMRFYDRNISDTKKKFFFP